MCNELVKMPYQRARKLGLALSEWILPFISSAQEAVVPLIQLALSVHSVHREKAID